MRHPLTAACALLLLSACARAAVAPPDAREYHRVGELEVSAVVESDEQSLLGMVEIMNPTRRTVRLQYAGACAVAYLFFGDDASTGAPLWQSSRWWAALQGSCPDDPLEMEIPPQTLARIMAPALDPGIVLGDSLQAGRYRSAIRLRLIQPQDTTLVLHAGPVRLDGAPDPPSDPRRPARPRLGHSPPGRPSAD